MFKTLMTAALMSVCTLSSAQIMLAATIDSSCNKSMYITPNVNGNNLTKLKVLPSATTFWLIDSDQNSAYQVKYAIGDLGSVYPTDLNPIANGPGYTLSFQMNGHDSATVYLDIDSCSFVDVWTNQDGNVRLDDSVYKTHGNINSTFELDQSLIRKAK